MNIFYLHENPKICAQYHVDKHCVKMIVETCQLLSSAHRYLDGHEIVGQTRTGRKAKRWVLPDYRETQLYHATHINHPSTVWTRESKANYQWHYKHFIALCDEYTYRYGKVHSTDTKLRIALQQIPTNIPEKHMTPFKLAMGSNPECMLEDAVESYRRFYETKQKRFTMVWTKRPVPKWFNAI